MVLVDYTPRSRMAINILRGNIIHIAELHTEIFYYSDDLCLGRCRSPTNQSKLHKNRRALSHVL